MVSAHHYNPTPQSTLILSYSRNISPKDVPDLGDPDRKRMLNVLAQRRYRQRRREKIAALEAQAKSLEGLVEQRSASSDGSSPRASLTSATFRSPDAIHELSVCQDGVEQLINASCEDDFLEFAVQEGSFDMALMQDFSDLTNLPTPLPSTPDLTKMQQTPTSSTSKFPMTADGGVLAFPVMSMVKALTGIATALNISDNLWDPSYMHVMPSSMCVDLSLPANLRPVPAQLIIPHHPAIDLLPWPTMREKLICMLAMPSKLRPPVAREEDNEETWPSMNAFGTSSSASQTKAITQLVHDVDDFQNGGGLIVHGNLVAWGHGNEYTEEAWEVGESFYRKWWFCIDEKIVAQSNRRRKERGLGRLRFTA
ncbi:hypothetical protein E8E12_001463 [Didymella heteroderae]|uniref:BZIP domain-containing protein n=1 Tax=Didymella heteroderae TaxID=1769908 RepID=A0A9P4WP47_9PLEO|nr:hypothetical protein E8E12_001463 [Didymella heteroderae]